MLKDVWRLCGAGLLTVDQVNVEVHLMAKAQDGRCDRCTAGAIYGLMSGARACDLLLHHKEVNTWKTGSPCVEYSFVSPFASGRALVNCFLPLVYLTRQLGAHSARGSVLVGLVTLPQ